MPESFKAFINPLAFLQVDEPWASVSKELPTLESIVCYLCTPGLDTDITALIARYREISTEDPRLFAPPAEERILEKLVWPLRHAKASYMVGNYLGAISLCGMVAEMVAMLSFDTADLHIKGRPATPEVQQRLFGSQFEKLGQHRRVEILVAYGLVDNSTYRHFEIIRLVRRRYLHLWSQDHDRIPQDAIQAFHSAVALVVGVVGQDVRKGKIYLNARLIKYLEKRGIYDPGESVDRD